MIRDHEQPLGKPVVVAIGDETRSEFEAPLRWLDERSQLRCLSSTNQGVQYLRSAPAAPALVVWLQSYLGQFGAKDIARVRSVEPSAEMICVYGALSEGELRTGKPLPGITRIPWYGWEARLLPAWPPDGTITSFQQESKPEWPSAARPHPADRTGAQLVSAVIGVGSACKDMAQLLIAACETAGHVGRWIDRVGAAPAPVEIAIWDDSADARHPVMPLDKFAAEVAPAPLIATMSFPRIDEVRQLSSHGVRYVLGKPLMIEDLLWQIESLIKVRQGVG